MLTINNTLGGYLKDVEILGNTIQAEEDLADIRSVGDKVGQELYEIPVLSCGKNINGKNLILGYLNSSNGQFANSNTNCVSNDFIKIEPNSTFKLTLLHDTLVINGLFLFNKDKIFTRNLGGASTISTDNSEYYIKIQARHRVSGTDISNIDLSKVLLQLEEGTVATEYEPYQEDKLTILSPTPLEKVGDVRDRIIEKNGVWGVEKNIATAILNGNEVWSLSVQTPYNRFLTKHIYIKAVDGIGVLSSKYKSSSFIDLWNNLDKESIASHNVDDGFLSIRANYSNVEEFKNSLKSNNILIKYIATQPTFIPLPHDQQIKLRTFANKTNISFGCEIEGTIKAQVPKSLGATVNTHTEQISNLNKELDRVKKLEESTVSTVEAESNFTTVEATSNGYFEDVKLEGKTLVNKFTFKDLTLSLANDELRVTLKDYIYSGVYTVVNTFGKDIMLEVYDKNSGNFSRNITIHSNSSTLVTILENERFDIIKGLTANGWDANSEADKEAIKKQLILGGDHTQNTPSYFEGLKSVGQSTDEIVVSSVKGDGNLFDGELVAGRYNTNTGILEMNNDTTANVNPIRVNGNTQYFINRVGLGNDIFTRILYYNSAMNLISSETKANATFITPNGCCYINFHTATTSFDSSLQVEIKKGSVVTEYTPHQTDKKRLLYYDEETQTWEKPILRQWDSIEKHANGKYYYHQRSGEVVLNGSESWGTNDGFSTGEYIACMTHVALPGKKYGVLNMISDKFKTKNCALLPVVEEGIWGEVGNSVVYISVSKSKLSTQDVTGFKQWLQANNITVVYQLAEEKVYECTNIDLITYNGETSYIVESGVISPRTILKVHNNISNVVKILQEKVSLLENKFIEGLKKVLAGDMYSLAELLYPEDFVEENPENEIMLLPFE